jgi:general stress protein YciG
MTRTARATDLGHQDGRSGNDNGDGVRRGEAGSRGGAISGEHAQPKQNAST